jgi:hypothetical protein
MRQHERMERIINIESLRAKIAAAESELTALRDQYRATLKKAGKPLSGIFGDSTYVTRESADLWVKEARAEGQRTQHALERLLEALPAPAPKNANEAHWMRVREAMISNARNGKQFEINPSKCDASYLAMRKRVDLFVNLDKVAKSVGLTVADIMAPGQLATRGGRTLAEKIVAAGAKARGEKTDDPDDPADNEGDDTPHDPDLVEVGDEDPAETARKILEAGRKRRGEPEPEGRRQAPLRIVREEPFAPTAEQILAAGRKARKPMGSD